MGKTMTRSRGRRSQKARLARLEALRGKRLSYTLRRRVLRLFRHFDEALAEWQNYPVPDQTEPGELVFQPVQPVSSRRKRGRRG